MDYFTYLVRCADGTLYCGSTDNLQKRLHAHNHLKSGAKYTAGRRPVEFAYVEKCATFADARKREVQIKKMTRAQKLQLCQAYVPVEDGNK